MKISDAMSTFRKTKNKIQISIKRLRLSVLMIQLFWLNLINIQWELMKIRLLGMRLNNGNRKQELLEREKSLLVKDLVSLRI